MDKRELFADPPPQCYKMDGLEIKVLYMSFDKFLLAVESRDLSQANKSIIRVSSFPKLRLSSRTSFSLSQN